MLREFFQDLGPLIGLVSIAWQIASRRRAVVEKMRWLRLQMLMHRATAGPEPSCASIPASVLPEQSIHDLVLSAKAKGYVILDARGDIV